MMKTKSCMAALTAVFLCLPVFTLPAYAQSTEPTEDPPAQEETTTAKPFTPEGTGTVVDNATDEDGKEFYTIQTPDEHVFFLVIDKQRTSENVYFLDAVTEKDLLSLAQSEKESETLEQEPEPTPAPPEPTNELFSDGMDYDPETLAYLDVLARLNRAVARRADRVYEVVCGIPIAWKVQWY